MSNGLKHALRLGGVSKSYGSVRALAGLSFDVVEGRFFALFGPSSVGKTTALRTIAGLVKPDSGRVEINGADVTDAAITGRGVSMVFQSFALYPHLTVYENFAYPLREEKIGREEIDKRVKETATMLKLSHLTSASGQGDLFWPLILRGMGLGLIFVPLTNATMADLKVKDLAQGTGMFNLMRQLGGSLGIAVMATLLARFMASEKAVLVEHVGANDPETLSRLSMITRGLISRGINPMTAQQQALAILDRQVSVQSSMLAFSRIYLYSGLVLLAALPLLLLFRTGRARGSMGPVH